MSDGQENLDVEALREGLLELADIIRRLDEEGELLAAAPELIKIFGDLRSQLFEYEVRHTGMFEQKGELPEVVEAQRIVDEAARQLEEEDQEWWRRFSSESDN